MSNSTNQQEHRIIGADGLRAIACLAVIGHHLTQKLAMIEQETWVQKLQSFLLMGNVGVSIFFVLSGFLLALPFWRKYLNDGEFPSIRQYIMRRAARIMPGYYVAFFVCIVLTFVLALPHEYFWIRTLTGLTFTAGFHYVTFFPSEWIGPFWSISFEVFSYILMPLFMYGLFCFFRKKRSFTLALLYWLAVFLIIMGGNYLIHHWFTPNEDQRGWQFGLIGGAKYWMPNYNVIGFFGHFTVGIIASGIVSKLQMAGSRRDHLRKIGLFDLLSLGSLVISILFIWQVRNVPEFDWSLQNQPFFFPYFTILMALFLVTAPYSRWVGNLLDNRFFRYTAKVSFGLYLWHTLFITLISMYWAKDFKHMGVVQLDRWAWISLGVVVASYIVATASYYFVEKPIMDWSRHHEKPRKPRNLQEETRTA
ncbi:acyltransferase family protein [Paenibacillus segetis]|uniref:Acyltransferase n=1 Tax=Paenibacillus segetis TaxID=1325360 RepID=A0ABQ1YP86_9BACL|nr:acyltransferase [Paenibacillus segetis]GGH31464.1 acyltransferase [Paenibacillus segetis]